MRAVRGLLSGAAVLAVVAGCAGAPGGASGGEAPAGGGDDVTYATFTTILQASADVPPELCLGGVMESYPPQCGGLELIGLDWEDVADAETASGVTWGTGWLVGTYDGGAGTFTLTEPASDTPPSGLQTPAPEDVTFPPLCEDPYRGGDETFDPSSPEAAAALEELLTLAPQLDGYITLYVSDGSSEHNVLVQGDAEAAHQRLREVWPGWLCVATGTGAAEADVHTAQQALHEELGDRVLGSGGGGTDGIVEVSVVVADEATTQAVLDAVEPWLTPEQVVVTGTLVPVD
ncbi:hypothetical protein [Pseudactinotalea suaedae]|uniref:hypothetical protein n=1 Tax=Pseudactinotalea suaedae TaxID=1524924 RepID=UPI0012E156B2|nr:hypothetical protein [Pseudactinotalea suaedae]